MGLLIWRLVMTGSLLAGLAACVTVPDRHPASPSGTVSAPITISVAGTKTSTIAAISSAASASTTEVPAPSPRYAITASPLQAASSYAGDVSVIPVLPGERRAPALLGGETPKEFQRGQASWYGPRFNGRRTASGVRFNMNEFTAAHRTLPFGTLVRVHSLVNGHDVDVRITDRGPYSGNRILDISRAAADELGMLSLGFKEVVLLVPESLPGVLPAAAPSAAPRRRVRRPAAAPTTRRP